MLVAAIPGALAVWVGPPATEPPVAPSELAQAKAPLRPGLEAPRNERAGGRARVVLLEPDTKAAEELGAQLAPFGYDTQVAATVEQAAAAYAAGRAVAMLVSVAGNDSPAEALAQLSQSTSARHERIPMLVLSSRSDLTARLDAVRGGSLGFLPRPVDAIRLVEFLDRLVPGAAERPYRVLIVDDDEMLALAYARILSDVGFETLTCLGAGDVLHSLAEARPDVIVMDMYMPDCSGPELAQVIRQDETYADVPIVFLSVESNIDRQLDALRIGGDEFLTKPIEPIHLIGSITARARRARAVRSLLIRDPLTGLANHTWTRLTLEDELARAARLGTPVSFAMLDIDHFKAVNDAFGHPSGDRVLRGLARLLLQRLRRTDLAGRMGGEEFGLVLPNAPAAAAARVVDEVRSCFAHLAHQASTGEFEVTLSAGIADFPSVRGVDQLIDAADQALYRAKAGGRNRVEVHRAAPSEPVDVGACT